jgi:hypothetical protein
MQTIQWWSGGQRWVHEDSRDVRCWPEDPTRPDEATPAPVGMRGAMRLDSRDVF